VLVPVEELLGSEKAWLGFQEEITGLIAKYQRTLQTDRRYLLQQYEFCDAARKMVGVGSVGTRCWIALMLGRDDSDPCSCRSRRPKRRC
jgi:uncharacterized protein (DUF2252 family)